MVTFLNLEYFLHFSCELLFHIIGITLDFPIISLLVAVLLYKLCQYLVGLPRVGGVGERYVLVTGCARGFGYDIARRLDSLGCHVFATCRSEKGMKELDKETSNRCHIIRMDVSNPQSVREAFQYVKAKLPPGKGLWGLVNNAGISGSRQGPIDWFTLDDYREVFEVNFLGTVDVTMTFLPLIKKARGRIVNMSSTMAVLVTPFVINYAVSKWGVEAFSDGLRRTLRPYGCAVLVLEPGMFRTDLTSEDHLAEICTAGWNSLPQETRDRYGEDYMEKYLPGILEGCKIDVGNKVSDVSDAVEKALFSRYPRARYMVGRDIRYINSNIAALPEWIGDWIMDRLFRIPPPKDIQQYNA